MKTHDDSPANDATDRRSTSTTYRRDSGELPSDSVVRVVAAVTGDEPIRMEPLYEAIDPDALDRVFDSTDVDSENSTDVDSEVGSSTRVSFRYQGCAVAVYGDGRVVVSRIDPD